MSQEGRPRGGGLLGGLFGGDDDLGPPELAPSWSNKPPAVWGTLRAEGGEVVAHLAGWRSVAALKKRVAVPIESVVRIVHDPAARAHIPTKLRRKAGQTGFVRVGPYHSTLGWSFWSIGLGRNAVVVETDGTRWRYLVIEVENPQATVAQLTAAVLQAGGTLAEPVSEPRRR